MSKIRIITGSAKGTRLISPKGTDTRPTSDRVKESLFNILSDNIIGKKVLDLFAGTGNLGIEAISRGADEAFFIDIATDKIIRNNLNRAHFEDKAKIFKGDVFKFLKFFEKKQLIFDLIFIDPPYYKGLSQKTMEILDSSTIFSDNGIIVLESGFNEEFSAYGNIEIFRKVSYGKTTQISLWKRKEVL